MIATLQSLLLWVMQQDRIISFFVHLQSVVHKRAFLPLSTTRFYQMLFPSSKSFSSKEIYEADMCSSRAGALKSLQQS